MGDPIRRLDHEAIRAAAAGDRPEWLVANGLGGFACGTVDGRLTRRYHGLLTAAAPPPAGRTMLFDLLSQRLDFGDGRIAPLGVDHSVADDVGDNLREFRLELGLPVWRFEVEGRVIERSVVLPYRENTAIVHWRLEDGAPSARLLLRPFAHFRRSDGPVSEEAAAPYTVLTRGDRHEIAGGQGSAALRLQLKGEDTLLTLDGGLNQEVAYDWESARGYDSRGVLWSPGCFAVTLRPGRDAWLIASSEPWETITARLPAEKVADERARRRSLIAAARPSLRESPADELVIAADSFVVAPPRARVRPELASGEELRRTVIAGYHWFTDWGRDTMISLEGLTLLTGREREARGVLLQFAEHIRHGLIPNLFPEHQSEGVYNTADATLWFFHALDRYVAVTGDAGMVEELAPRLIDIVDHHLRGTDFGISVDPGDGLLRQGAEGYQLTWMDAKVGDWVVTPRRGKAVEINALWHNALRLLARWISGAAAGDGRPDYAQLAEQVRRSFNERFWYDEGGYLYDVVDGEAGDDASLRPNQIFAISTTHPVLDERRWGSVLEVVERELVTPVGLRSLGRDHPNYAAQYSGDLRARDAAYHQGTVWAWLIGPFIDAYVRVHPERRAEARRFVEGFVPHLDHACVGSISEIFDAAPPFRARGCVSQAWSVAEALRAWDLTQP